ncbi:MAG: nucleotidyltransferase domain-containing protein [Candidatus Hadarchaeota archaeon]
MLGIKNTISKGTVELRKFGGENYPYLKVTLGRLVKRGAAVKVRRGVYFIPSPENVSKLQALRENLAVYQIVRSIYSEFHRDLKLVLLYGSYARGDFDKKSDVDVLVVAKRGAKDLANRLSKQLGLRVDIRVISESYFKRLMVVEPKVHFWLKEGLVFDEAGVTKEVYPVGKIGIYEALRSAELQLELSRAADTSSKKGYHLLVALRELLTLKHALGLDFDYRNVKEELAEVAGRGAIEKLRGRGKSSVTGGELHRWKLSAEKLYLGLKRVYGKLGESIGDLYVKKLVRHEHE